MAMKLARNRGLETYCHETSTCRIQLEEHDLNFRDDGDERVTIMEKCLLTLGNNFDRIVYTGDAEWDMQATEKLGWHFIGVGARLKGKCDFWIEDFSSHDTFMKMLHT